MKKHLILFFSLFIIGLSACKKTDVTAQQASIDDAKIQAYLKANNITAVKDASGLYYQIVKAGTGAPTVGSTVQLTFTNAFLNGIAFSSATVQTFKMTGLVKGLQIGLSKIGTGGRIILFIPSALAYGPTETDSVPANSVFTYTIDMIGYY